MGAVLRSVNISAFGVCLCSCNQSLECELCRVQVCGCVRPLGLCPPAQMQGGLHTLVFWSPALLTLPTTTPRTAAPLCKTAGRPGAHCSAWRCGATLGADRGACRRELSIGVAPMCPVPLGGGCGGAVGKEDINPSNPVATAVRVRGTYGVAERGVGARTQQRATAAVPPPPPRGAEGADV